MIRSTAAVVGRGSAGWKQCWTKHWSSGSQTVKAEARTRRAVPPEAADQGRRAASVRASGRRGAEALSGRTGGRIGRTSD